MTNKVYYCNEDDVRRLLGLDSTAISDKDTIEFIKIAQEEVDSLTHTTFLTIQDKGTAASATADTLVDSNKSWTADEWNAEADLIGGYMVYIYSGTGAGQVRTIIDNDATSLTVSPDWTTTPDNTSLYRIFKNTYVDETFDGDGSGVYFTQQYPILGNVLNMTIDSTDVTPSTLYKTASQGKLQLSHESEVLYYTDTYPLLCNVKYFYGAYPADQLVRDICSVSAAIILATYMIGGTYTFVTSYSVPDMSVNKGVPYPHFNTAIAKLEAKRTWLLKNILNKITRPMFA